MRENILRVWVRFKTATLLNVIGLSVAFASFMYDYHDAGVSGVDL